ncbi:dTDP-4-dehydrorhamnose reductase [Flavobacterium sp. Fl-77]|uniref:dTDP-4-dehydrorhamnose reductase n=1 Tax=Flavobacterium flavipigmentatum TaxID=2893884 RepID=A0AAJ2VXZ8_9FLAO|nr:MULTISPECIES: dTDP-4-dehydrorhamnose reductase [unclassified Flavobacterium]MDX6182222.1 dTDP-4-dehydrorhamnose reductase [Flavobacterium sp. Fl-33]MDX6185865.1 dTDP-4-dehydrorhamnose reductase [Flavobacterium sp. Fl-77]UFH39044.1 dTDP-4-dehydrorhamnose reductase [Flavobacterium sp. F-70]
MKKILVTGANGQLGSELSVLSSKYPEYNWIFADRTQITLDNLEVLKLQLNEIKPDIILNCGAYTAVDKAETETEFAFTINELSVKLIAEFALENRAKLIHISTDYVFDGTSSVALNEEEKTNPINVYGASKRAGEIACLEKNPDAIIIRTSWVYSKFGNNFVKTMQRLMQERESLNVVNDQIGSPTYAADLAQAILDILKAPNWIPGIYNYSNEGEISWYEFALDIKEFGGYNCNVSGIPSAVYPTPAKRPEFSLLDKKKIKTIYNLEVPYYKESLKKIFM